MLTEWQEGVEAEEGQGEALNIQVNRTSEPTNQQTSSVEIEKPRPG
jgi:hypothetical protein